MYQTQPIVSTSNLNEGCIRIKNVMTVWSILMTWCSLHLGIFLFCNQINRLIYRSSACFDAILFTISTSYSQSIKLVEPVRLHTGAVYIEEKAVYMNSIPGKTIQWETRKKSCSIINIWNGFVSGLRKLKWQSKVKI